MNATTTRTIESVPTTWDTARDDVFFRITADLFSHDLVYAAGVLLASYDVDESAS